MTKNRINFISSLIRWQRSIGSHPSLNQIREAQIILLDAGRFTLAKIEADENMKLAGRYQLRGFPTAILFINGEPVDQFSGARPPQFVREFLDRHLDKLAATGPG